MYGLPAQTVESVARTAAAGGGAQPDRIAVFGYAHVPWFKKHQKMIDDAELPGVAERYAQAITIEDELSGAGYAAIGLDHFALPHDELTIAAGNRALRRNFQGYTTDVSDALLSFGASAIGEFPQGFVQSARDTLRMVARRSTATKAPSPAASPPPQEDRMRSEIIERLMCDLERRLRRRSPPRHGFGARSSRMFPKSSDRPSPRGMATLDGTRVSRRSAHRLFLRTVAAAFDTHFVSAPNRHAKAV